MLRLEQQQQPDQLEDFPLFYFTLSDTQTVPNAKHKRRQITERREIKFRSNNPQLPQLYRIFFPPPRSTQHNTNQLSLSLSVGLP